MFARTACLFAAAIALLLSYADISSHAQTTAPAALTGKVSSAEEGLMEGVVVSAKQGIVTVSVVSNDKGEFSFPASKLGPGTHALSIKASGYDLQGPQSVTVAGGPVNIDVRLVKTRNLAAQLTNQEWIASAPGTPDQKRILSRCVNCHGIDRVVTSTYDAQQMIDVIKRMATYSNNSFFRRPQLRKAERDMERFVPNLEREAAYLASVNRSATGELSYPLKTVPRVKGAGTRVIITEYDLPNPDTQPHDVIVDAQGIVWHSDFSGQILGRFDPRTLTYKAHDVPLQREGWPTGALDLETDPNGHLWLGLMFQAGVARFDPKTERFQMYQLPPGVLKDDSQQAMVAPHAWTVDNKLWLQDPSLPGVYRMDMTTGQTEMWKPFEKMKGPHSVYGIYADPQNNLWFLDFGGENVGVIDSKTGVVTLYPTPTRRSRPRRGRFDNHGRLWFAEFGQERVGMFDTRTKQFTEWQLPVRDFSPYDVVLDKNGDLWTGGMNADRILRLNTETGDFTEYPLPRYTNIRRVFVDDNTTPPTFWIGNNHGAALIKLEPLD